MVKRDELISFIEEVIDKDLIKKATKEDTMANGVQVLGGEDVSVVTLGTSINEEFLEKAIKKKSNFCIFHHGIDVRVWVSRFPTYSQKRLRLIFQNNMTVMGFHYCLDVHPEIGHSVVIAKKLGAKVTDTLFEGWGVVAEFNEPQHVKKLEKVCQKLINHDVFSVLSGPENVRTIGVVSGGGKPYAMHLHEMEEKGVELFITGETSESVPHKMKESNINYFVCGHYATEVFGVKELATRIQEEFGTKVTVEFIDVPNPI